MGVSERIVARLRLEEDGSLSNKRVEQYALLRSEEVMAQSAAWTVIMSSERGNLPSGGYQKNIHKSPAFKARLEGLMAEKAEFEDGGVWGRVEWQARQLYRKAAAMNDLGGMQKATDTLMQIAKRKDRPPEREAANDGDEEKRGRGAPSIPVPEPEDEAGNSGADYMRERLIRS